MYGIQLRCYELVEKLWKPLKVFVHVVASDFYIVFIVCHCTKKSNTLDTSTS